MEAALFAVLLKAAQLPLWMHVRSTKVRPADSKAILDSHISLSPDIERQEIASIS